MGSLIQLKNRIEQIREQIGDEPKPYSGRRYKSKRICKKSKSNMKVERKKNNKPNQPIITAEEKKFISDNRLRLNGICAEICREIKWAKEYPYNDRMQAYINIQKQISDLIADNERTFGYDRYKTFSQEEIDLEAERNANELFRDAIENGIIRYDEDLPGYVDECDIPISEYDFKFSDYCRELAKTNLLKKYGNRHQAGYDCDGRISRVERSFKELEQCVTVREQFRLSVANNNRLNIMTANDNSIQSPLLNFIIRDSEKVLAFIDNELKSCDNNQGKLVAMIIITLCEEGYFVQYKRKLTKIHKAFSDSYPNKIAGLSAIVDYINGYYKPSDNNTKRIPDYELAQLKTKLK